MGRLLVLEGLDGSGKSTQMGLLQKKLESRDIPYQRIKAPDYSSPSSALVTMYLNGEFGSHPNDVNAYAASTFYAADRYACFHNKWKQAYSDGEFVVADRYTTSNAIFQMPKLDRELWDSYLNWLEDFEYKKLGLPKPSLVIYLDVPVDISQKLLEKRYAEDGGQKDVHEQDRRYQMLCRDAAAYAAKYGGWEIIPCAEGETLRSAEDISNDIFKLVTARLTEDFHL